MKQNNHFSKFASSSVSILLAETISLPFDVVKTRLQIQNNISITQTNKSFNGLFDCMSKTVKNEGYRSLWKGWIPAIMRSVSYGSLAVTLYEPIRDRCYNYFPNDLSCLNRIFAGGLSGAIAITVFNPTEVIKTRLQSNQSNQIQSISSVTRKIYSEGGIKSFWSGIRPNIMRTFLVNAAELGTYDQFKSLLIPHFGNSLTTQVSSSFGAGLISTLVSTPMDVIKTRMMNDPHNQYGIFKRISGMFRDEGLTSLYKGGFTILIRKVIWCSTFFVAYERIRPITTNGFND